MQRVSNRIRPLSRSYDFLLNNFKLFSWKPHTGEVSVPRRGRALLPVRPGVGQGLRRRAKGEGTRQPGSCPQAAHPAQAGLAGLGPRQPRAPARAVLQDPRGVDGRDRAPREGAAASSPRPQDPSRPQISRPPSTAAQGKLCRPGPRMCPKVGHLRLPPDLIPSGIPREPPENLPRARPPRLLPCPHSFPIV